MPAVSARQQRFFGAIKGGAIQKPKGMSAKTVDDFASTPAKGLPDTAADVTTATHSNNNGARRRRYFGAA